MSVPPYHESPYPLSPETEGRLARLETKMSTVIDEIHELGEDVKGMRAEMVRFAYVVAGSGIGIALTVFFTR